MASTKITHALVYFTSNRVKKIVSVESVVDFHPKSETDFEKKSRYKVWFHGQGPEGNDLLLKAYVLLLGDSESAVQQKQETCRVKLPNLKYMSRSSEGGTSPASRKQNSKARSRANTTSQVIRRKMNPQPKDVAMREAHLNIINKYKKFMHTRPDSAETSEGDENADDPPLMRRSDSEETVIMKKTCNAVVQKSPTTVRRRLFDDRSGKRQGSTSKDEGSCDQDNVSIHSSPHVLTPETPRQESPSQRLTRSLTTPNLDSSKRQAALTGRGLLTSIARVPKVIYNDEIASQSEVGIGSPRSDTSSRSIRRRTPVYNKSRLTHRSGRDSPVTSDASPSSSAAGRRRLITNGVRFQPTGIGSRIQADQRNGGSLSNRTPRTRESNRNSSLLTRNQSRSVVIGRRTIAESTPRMDAHGRQQERSRPLYPMESIRRRANVPQEMAEIYEGVRINRDTWEVMLHTPDSRFVKDVAVLLWGEDELAKRCLNARQTNRHLPDGEAPRTELTPEKHERVKDCLFHKLTEAGVIGRQRAIRMSRMWRYISYKIYDIRKGRCLRQRRNRGC